MFLSPGLPLVPRFRVQGFRLCHLVWYNAIMITTLTMDKAGRVVLPKAVREELQLSPGDSLEVESSEERIILRPVRGNGRIYKKQRVWVMHGGGPLSVEAVEKTIDQIRREREQSFLGKRK
jgi:AbrB family looped-hinge helix DNA binding protein